MKILLLTPDIDIDRRIVLQVNALVREGNSCTIVAVPGDDSLKLSGGIDNNILIKRINLSDLEYESKMINYYKKIHTFVNKSGGKRNEILNHYSNKNMRALGNNPGMKILIQINNLLVRTNIKVTNKITTICFLAIQKMVNIVYKFGLLYMKLTGKFFIPVFDKAFYNAAINEDADIIVANDLPTLKAAFDISKVKSIPLVYDAHEIYTEQSTLPKTFAKKLESIEKEVLPKTSFWIIPNELSGNFIVEKYKKQGVVVPEPLVIQNAVSGWADYSNYNNKNTIRNTLGLGNEKKILLYQGGFLPKRNLNNVIISMKYVKNSNIVLVMLGFGAYRKELEKIVEKHHLTNKVYFMNPVPQDELLKYTCTADVGIIPYPAVDVNTYFCSPNKLYEFIQARLPILANDMPFLKKTVKDNDIGEVCSFKNPKTIAAAVDRIFDKMTKLHNYKSNQDKLSYKFSWEAEEKKLLNMYKCIEVKEANII